MLSGKQKRDKRYHSNLFLKENMMNHENLHNIITSKLDCLIRGKTKHAPKVLFGNVCSFSLSL